MDGACGTNGERGNTYGVLVGTRERSRPLQRPRLTWENNIKMDLKGVEWQGEDGLFVLRIETSGGLL
jgi:hypothetical protein